VVDGLVEVVDVLLEVLEDLVLERRWLVSSLWTGKVNIYMQGTRNPPGEGGTVSNLR
jgi:hypothetical protein